jgi:hypothetical protein
MKKKKTWSYVQKITLGMKKKKKKKKLNLR